MQTSKLFPLKHTSRLILHVDANSFYASVEESFNPNLKNKPVAVSGDTKKRNGIILAKNETAKKAGVQTGETIWQAKQKCPDLICLTPHMEIYEEYSKKLKQIYLQYTELVEPFGIDECWLDITHTAHLFGGARQVAEKIKTEVKQKLKITVSIGISFCKLFAKLGSDLKKPDAITEISLENYKKIVYPLPVTAIIGIAGRLERRFHKLNCYTLGDITKIDDYVLKNKFGIIGLRFKEKLLGRDTDPVASSQVKTLPKSVGNGTTTTRDIFLEEEIKTTVTFLATLIAPRLRKLNAGGKRISVSIKNIYLQTTRHSKAIRELICEEEDIIFYAMNLINSFWKYDEKIRAIRISISKLEILENKQLDFLNIKKRLPIGKSLDYINKKYGKNTIFPASNHKSFLNN